MKNYLFKIVLSATFLFAANAFSQTLSGTITSDSQPLPGVNIVIKGTLQGTQTDFEGQYILENVPPNAVITCSYLGFKTQEFMVNGRDKVDVVLVEDAATLDEVVIIGLGQTQNKRTVSTAIAKVSSEEIKELSITRPEAALQGTMPGVVVAQNSGSPGAPLAVRVRGVSTPNSADPLYLVDGFQVPNLQHLNAGDIATINILKDAAAVAVYGARGGSGVVLVETKKGVRNMDRFKATIEGYYGFQNVRRESDLMNRDEYTFFYKSALQYANTFGEQYRPAVFNTIGEVTAFQDALPDTDWQDLIFADNAPIQNLHASVSDGGETYSWGVSAGFFEQGGVVGGPDKSNFERKNIHLNLDFDILKNLTVSANADLVGMDQKRVLENENNETNGIGIVTAANAVAPIYQAYDDKGVPINPSFGTGGPNANNQVYSNGVLLNSMNIYTSPLFMLMAADQLQTTDVQQYGGNIKWDPLDNLRVVGSYSRFSSKATFKAFQPDFAGTPITDEQYYFVLIGNQLNQNEWTRDIDNFDANAEYTFKNIGKNHLRGLIGTSYQHDQGTALFRQGNNLTENTFDKASLDQASVVTILNPADQTNGFTTSSNESKLFSIYARAIYDFDEKYLFTASIRADKSSKFGPNNQTGYFPAVSAGWVISQESFLKDSDAINLLKLRASWGINGVDNIREDEYNTVYNDDFEISRLGNPDIKWEEIEQTNIGLDLNAFNNKLGLTLDYYIKNTNDILLELPPQLSSGAPGETFQNAGGVKNEGFEALLSFRSIAKEVGGFSWSASANVGFNKNTFEADPSIPPGSLTGGNLRQFGTPVTNTLGGYGISSFYGYKVDYINNRGELIFKDLDGDGVVNSVGSNGASITDLDDRTIIGNPYPDVTYGLLISASYRGFDLNANLYGATGNDIFDARYNSAVPFSNRSRDYLTYGLRPVLSGLAGSQGEVSDFYVKDGSFAKLKNVTLGYSFKQAAEQVGLEQLRIFIQGQNLWTITNYKGGDPEIGPASDNPNSALDVGIDRGFYPQPTTFMLGFQFEY
ncbi:SusC/RagA family TonB-linked outer membrane protein [Tamlana sp. I1]|uniref:SusC/RagA family TonB-linked outer membrane protein n=1 Tax=Tamlana sp. I1 TaxID=2762061 RepID=UPI00188F79F5|nr:SusC/RagA family TonB-linked outer membrane protein [Tamlana sp. I1]